MFFFFSRELNLIHFSDHKAIRGTTRRRPNNKPRPPSLPVMTSQPPLLQATPGGSIARSLVASEDKKKKKKKGRAARLNNHLSRLVSDLRRRLRSSLASISQPANEMSVEGEAPPVNASRALLIRPRPEEAADMTDGDSQF